MKSAAEEIAKTVGRRIREVITSGTANVSFDCKGPGDLVTEVDLWSERTITAFVTEHFPDHIVFGEETSADLCAGLKLSPAEIFERNTCWVIDPIDGTTNFANAIPHCCVSIGIYQEGVGEIGVVYDPSRDELFSAQRGKGAKRNGERIACGNKSKIEDSVINTGFPYDRAGLWDRYRPPFEFFLKRSRNVRVMGAAALDQAWVACGRVDGFYEYNLKAWDVAAGAIIVTEAGGQVANFAEDPGKPFSIFADSYLCAGAPLFPQMLDCARAAAQDAR